ncbi:hypothetical protein Moror_17912 [Moniliophthora roreri MCA 2997]|uniref:Lysine-specific metallo-endopeptidase domain-containing protein n=1 Tax=Moniliophthora roreri (strain MCA 2997) TaxID=1381753 RepID=V2XWL7_MONRO|nr:hypothetical protein Moror_17912 [Moniliophthora roreri MCA 2997]
MTFTSFRIISVALNSQAGYKDFVYLTLPFRDPSLPSLSKEETYSTMFSVLAFFTIAAATFTTVAGLAFPADLTHGLAKRAVFNCSDPAKLSIINAAYGGGKSMASDARTYIASHGANDALVKQYFGNNTSLIPRVSWIYNQIATEAGMNYTLTCDYDPAGACASGTVVARNTRYRTGCNFDRCSRTDFCPRFYNRLPMSCSTNINSMNGSREDTIIHEMSHALGDTTDFNGSCSSARTLALNNATAAIINAYNYGCFAMEVYKATRC